MKKEEELKNDFLKHTQKHPQKILQVDLSTNELLQTNNMTRMPT
jgi:hypothetical protein